MNDRLQNLKMLLDKGQETALLYYSIGKEYFYEQEFEEAVKYLKQATQRDRQFSAAWKVLGKCLVAKGDYLKAIAAFEQGITVAESKGDVQAQKEMQVFLKRAQKQLPQSN